MARRAGQIIPRGDRKFTVRVFLGRDGSGRRKYVNRSVHGTSKDAQKVLNALLRERDLGTLKEPELISLNEHLDRWLVAVARPRLAENTFNSYTWLLNQYVRPRLGDEFLHHLSPSRIQSLVGGMIEADLSPRTIRYTHSVLRTALQQAVKWGHLRSNPADAVDLPKQRRNELCAMTDDEAKRFLAAAMDDDYHALWSLMLSTGLRPSEAIALRWPDINLDTGEFQVRRTITRPRGGGWHFKEPKTAGSRRHINVPPSTLEALKRHRKNAVPSPHELVFCNADGEALDINNLSSRHYKRVLARAGLKGFRLYDLRHTCATLLLLAGVHPKVVSERLGHSSIRQTLDTYSHVLPSMQQQASAALEEVLFSPPANTRPRTATN